MRAAKGFLSVCWVYVAMRAELEAAFPGRFTFTADRDYFDYVYLRSDRQRFVEKSTSLNGIISIGLKQLILIMNIRS